MRLRRAFRKLFPRSGVRSAPPELDERLARRKDGVVKFLAAACLCLGATEALEPAGAARVGPTRAAVARQEPERKERPTAADVAEQLRLAFERGSAPQRVVALRASAAHADAAVVAQARRGLGDRDTEVRLAAYDALGRNAHAAAFEALLAHHKDKRKELRALDRDLPALLTALARRGDARALAPLGDDVQAQRLVPTIRARMLGFARIRDKGSIEGLMKLVEHVGFVDMHNHLEDFRLAMVVLSGVDRGRSVEAWRAWWNGVKQDFVPAERGPELAAQDASRWRDFWRDAPLGDAEAR
jgi:hypothetical protein